MSFVEFTFSDAMLIIKKHYVCFPSLVITHQTLAKSEGGAKQHTHTSTHTSTHAHTHTHTHISQGPARRLELSVDLLCVHLFCEITVSEAHGGGNDM